MKKISALVLGLMFAGVTFASPVTYSTSAVFSGPDLSGGNLVNGGATIKFTGVPLTPVDAPTNINIGSITATGGTGTFVGDSILLTITQTVPSAGSGNSSSTVAGTITSTSNGVDLHFVPTSFNIGQVTYLLQADYFLVAPNTNNGVTTLQANVTVPEPASLGFIGASLMGLGLAYRRRASK